MRAPVNTHLQHPEIVLFDVKKTQCLKRQTVSIDRGDRLEMMADVHRLDKPRRGCRWHDLLATDHPVTCHCSRSDRTLALKRLMNGKRRVLMCSQYPTSSEPVRPRHPMRTFNSTSGGFSRAKSVCKGREETTQCRLNPSTTCSIATPY